MNSSTDAYHTWHTSGAAVFGGLFASMAGALHIDVITTIVLPIAVSAASAAAVWVTKRVLDRSFPKRPSDDS